MAGGRMNIAELPQASPSTMPVFLDDDGEHHILLQDAAGQAVAVPYITGEQLGWDGANQAEGGFLALEDIPPKTRILRERVPRYRLLSLKAVKPSAAGAGGFRQIPLGRCPAGFRIPAILPARVCQTQWGQFVLDQFGGTAIGGAWRWHRRGASIHGAGA
jgi:hypothetical protein